MSEPPFIPYARLATTEKPRRPIRFPVVGWIGLLYGMASVVVNVIADVAIYPWLSGVNHPAALVRQLPPQLQAQLLTRANIWFILVENGISALAGLVLMIASRLMLSGSRQVFWWARLYAVAAVALSLSGVCVGILLGDAIAIETGSDIGHPVQRLEASLLIMVLSWIWPYVIFRATSGPLAESYFTLD